MGYVHFLLLLIINTALCFYLYNPRTHNLIIRTSLKNIPRGYKLVPPPRNYTRKQTRGRLTQQCGDGGFRCNAPYDRALTFQFDCANDDNCPSNYRCCSHKCFLHKICIKTASPSPVINGGGRTGQCERWPYNCRRPYPYSFSSRFRCDRDGQCPRNFKCCQQSCFSHKICSRIVGRTEKPPIKIQAGGQSQVRPESEVSTSENRPEYLPGKAQTPKQDTSDTSDNSILGRLPNFWDTPEEENGQSGLNGEEEEEETTERTTPTTTEATTPVEEDVDEEPTEGDDDEEEATTQVKDEEEIVAATEEAAPEEPDEEDTDGNGDETDENEPEPKPSTKATEAATEADEEEVTPSKITTTNEATEEEEEDEEKVEVKTVTKAESTEREDHFEISHKATTLDSNAIDPNEATDYYDSYTDETEPYANGDEDDEEDYNYDENDDN